MIEMGVGPVLNRVVEKERIMRIFLGEIQREFAPTGEDVVGIQELDLECEAKILSCGTEIKHRIVQGRTNNFQLEVILMEIKI